MPLNSPASRPRPGLGTARSVEDRAVCCWIAAALAATVAATIEPSVPGGALAAALAVLWPGRAYPATRAATALLALGGLAAGAFVALVCLAVALVVRAGVATAVMAVAATAAAAQLAPIASTHVEGGLLTMPLASGLWLATALLPTAAVVGYRHGGRAALAVAAAAPGAFLVLDLAATGRWIGVAEITEPAWRVLSAAGAAALAALAARPAPAPAEPPPVRGGAVALAALALGAVFAQVPGAAPLRGVVFDEAHGRWETVQASYGPDDFGRAATYTYSLLADYARALTGAAGVFQSEADPLPPPDTAFVLKMPTKPLSDGFGARLAEWVEAGGRLVVVADHTDLYDTAQHLNRLLDARWGVAVRADAAYDRAGRPNAPAQPSASRALGRIDAWGSPLPWLTGATAAGLPLRSVALAGFGPAFAEPGDYGRPNRFGPFLPRATLPYATQPAVVAFPAGEGVVSIVLDSTPWSNFAVFREEYRRLFRGLLGALGEPLALGLLGSVGLGLAATLVAAALSRRPEAVVVVALLLGTGAGLGWRVSASGLARLADGTDHGLRIVPGRSARLEFLPQLVLPGERNYSRIASALGKYGLVPVASAPGSAAPELSDARAWLFLEPDAHQLPPAHAVFAHLRGGGDLAALLAPHAAADPAVRAWLHSLDLSLASSAALAVAEDAGRPGRGGFAARRGAGLIRDARPVTAALETGLLKEHAFDRFWQTYTVRPTTLPRTGGLLTVGFGADQITDAAMGDVWEGVRPSALGALRERQLGALLRGEDAPGPWPEALFAVPAAGSPEARFGGFLVIEDGRVAMEGRFEERDDAGAIGSPPGFIEAPKRYLADLRRRALALLNAACPAGHGANATECSTRLLGADGMEWLVSRSDQNGVLVAMELLHERRWSSVGADLNVVFAD